jgi:hypothetical protein
MTTDLEKMLAEALSSASDHLDLCGYGDAWERECAKDAGLSEQIDQALKAYRELRGEEKP